MSKKHKIAKKEALAQKKLYEEEVTDLENEKIKEVESGVVEVVDEGVSMSENEGEVVVEDEKVEETNVDVNDAKNDNTVTPEVSKDAEKPKTEKGKDGKADNSKADSKNKKDKDKKKKDKKNKKGLIKKTKETASELKKVTWPTFGEVVKKTGIVIAFVVIFGLLIFGIDTLLGFLSRLLVL